MHRNDSALNVCLGFWGFRPLTQEVNSQTTKLCTETPLNANILSYTLLSRPYTQVQGSIITIVCLNIPQVPRGGVNFPLSPAASKADSGAFMQKNVD